MNECRVCGCSDFDACFDPETGAGCYWVDEDLCSVCARDNADVAEVVGDLFG